MAGSCGAPLQGCRSEHAQDLSGMDLVHGALRCCRIRVWSTRSIAQPGCCTRLASKLWAQAGLFFFFPSFHHALQVCRLFPAIETHWSDIISVPGLKVSSHDSQQGTDTAEHGQLLCPSAGVSRCWDFSHAGSRLFRAPTLAAVIHHLEHQRRVRSSILLHPSLHTAPVLCF